MMYFMNMKNSKGSDAATTQVLSCYFFSFNNRKLLYICFPKQHLYHFQELRFISVEELLFFSLNSLLPLRSIYFNKLNQRSPINSSS
ncbi:unnamed protein product [Amoebophrya sp. A25]|nr:unnamed protein product [Amoebophrya sp. A25]|eukprot:GSA25T00027184001.1